MKDRAAETSCFVSQLAVNGHCALPESDIALVQQALTTGFYCITAEVQLSLSQTAWPWHFKAGALIQ
jgi:hypothetical protein